MRTRDAMERLEAAGRPLLADADSLVGDGDAERILERIVANDRRPRHTRAGRRLRPAALLAGAGLVAAAVAVAATGAFRSASHRSIGLSGARLELAGYRFRTPAGFKEETSSCGPTNDFNGFAAAASADGGCLEAFVMFSSRGSAVPAGADSVIVGAYQGYFVSADASQQASLYVVLPTVGEFVKWQALVLDARGLTEDQLVAVAESGLPRDPQAASTIGPT